MPDHCSISMPIDSVSITISSSFPLQWLNNGLVNCELESTSIGQLQEQYSRNNDDLKRSKIIKLS